MANILLIDDDTELTSLLKDLLELEGYSVNIADNGQQGLKKLPSTPTWCYWMS